LLNLPFARHLALWRMRNLATRSTSFRRAIAKEKMIAA
jgi:hypothetical protein